MHPSDALIAHYRAMAENNAWSNHRLQVACAALSKRDYRATRASFFPSLHLTLRHILEVDRFYIDQLEGDGIRAPGHGRRPRHRGARGTRPRPNAPWTGG